MQNKRPPILLTGGTGHTGRRLATALLAEGYPLRCLLHTPSRRHRLPPGQAGLEVVHGSLEDPGQMRRALEGIDTVLHTAHIRFAPALLAALASRQDPVRLIATSSTRLLSRFPTPLRQLVQGSEQAIQAAPEHIQWTILRPAMIFGGPDDNNIERLAGLLARTPVFPLIGGGANLVQPLFVRDLVDAFLATLQQPRSIRHAITLAGPEPLSYKNLIEEIVRASGSRRPLLVPLPLAPCRVAARALATLWVRSPLPPEAIDRFAEDRAFDIAPARELLDFQPTPLDQALRLKFSRQV